MKPSDLTEVKKPYVAPDVVEYGSVERLTEG